MLAIRADQHPIVAHEIEHPLRFRPGGLERCTVANQLYAKGETDPAYVPDDAVMPHQVAELAPEVSARLARVLLQPFLPPDIKHGIAGRRGRIAAPKGCEA